MIRIKINFTNIILSSYIPFSALVIGSKKLPLVPILILNNKQNQICLNRKKIT